jgi:hypothetical protein
MRRRLSRVASELEQAITSTQSELTKQMDEQILKFFGSYDELLKYGYLYKIEAEPVKMEMVSHADLGDRSNTIMCQTIMKLRIRFKTHEELEADRHD